MWPHGGTWGCFRGVWNITISGSQTFSSMTRTVLFLNEVFWYLWTIYKKTIWFDPWAVPFLVSKSLFDDIFDIIKKIFHIFYFKSCFCYCNFFGKFWARKFSLLWFDEKNLNARFSAELKTLRFDNFFRFWNCAHSLLIQVHTY